MQELVGLFRGGELNPLPIISSFLTITEPHFDLRQLEFKATFAASLINFIASVSSLPLRYSIMRELFNQISSIALTSGKPS